MASPGLGSPPPQFSFGGYAIDTTGLQGVGFWPRAVARLIDMAMHFIISMICGFFVGVAVVVVVTATQGNLQSVMQKFQNTALLSYLLAFVGSVMNHSLSEGIGGRTIGKLILGQVVVKEDGSPCGIKAGLIRSFGYFVDALFFGAVGYSNMKKTPKQQRHGDEWAGTMVCKKSDLPDASLRSRGRIFLGVAAGIVADGVLLTIGVLTNLL
jgi:uncharacterized RDD family membrane protein YckC